MRVKKIKKKPMTYFTNVTNVYDIGLKTAKIIFLPNAYIVYYR